jgi:hypothetical protein
MTEAKTVKPSDVAPRKNPQVHTVGLSTTGNSRKVDLIDGSDERVAALVASGLTEEQAIELVKQVNFF